MFFNFEIVVEDDGEDQVFDRSQLGQFGFSNSSPGSAWLEFEVSKLAPCSQWL